MIAVDFKAPAPGSSTAEKSSSTPTYESNYGQFVSLPSRYEVNHGTVSDLKAWMVLLQHHHSAEVLLDPDHEREGPTRLALRHQPTPCRTNQVKEEPKHCLVGWTRVCGLNETRKFACK